MEFIQQLEWDLESLLIPEVDSVKEAGRLLQNVPQLWTGATVNERHQPLTTVLDGVYVDLKASRSIVSVKAKPAFEVILGMTAGAFRTDRLRAPRPSIFLAGQDVARR